MNVKQAAERMEISRSLLYRLLAEGRISCRRIGQRGRRGKIVLDERDVKEFLERVKEEAVG